MSWTYSELGKDNLYVGKNWRFFSSKSQPEPIKGVWMSCDTQKLGALWCVQQSKGLPVARRGADSDLPN